MSNETIGSALRTRRAKLGLDQRDASSRIGMSRTTYSSYERNTQRPSVEVLPAIALFLEISIDVVLELYGASAVEAARTALGRLAIPAPVESSPGATTTITTASEYIDDFDDYNGTNGSGNFGLTTPLPEEPYRPATSTVSTPSSPLKNRDEKEKSKKKKGKKGKREKLVNPAFASHV
jgi:transcriptional regulator with XRE-family HTH domain